MVLMTTSIQLWMIKMQSKNDLMSGFWANGAPLI